MGCSGSKAGQAGEPRQTTKGGSVRDNAKPIIVYSERTLPEGEEAVEKYKSMKKLGNDMIWDTVAGCKAIISIPHATKPNVWHDIQWFNSQEAFNQHVDMNNKELMEKVQNWVGTYDMAHPFTGDIFGDWHEMAKKATGGFGA